jgi:glycosyltransferase involved in cell wall biosynthesis
MSSNIGVGIITCNRPDFFEQCFKSIPSHISGIDHIVIVNDGSNLPSLEKIKPISQHQKITYIQNRVNKQVGYCKNQAMSLLLDDKDIEYIFTIEDDIKIKDPDVFWKYVEAYKETGIQHFNFGFSQKENLDKNLRPVYRKIVEYKNCNIVLTPNILGAFTFYTRTALKQIGLHHHKFNKGHGDHPELTYRAYKHGLTSPFWWFADIENSWDMLENLSNMGSDSLVRNQSEFMANFKEACDTFKELHGVGMLEVPDVGETQAIGTLIDIYRKHKQ